MLLLFGHVLVKRDGGLWHYLHYDLATALALCSLGDLLGRG